MWKCTGLSLFAGLNKIVFGLDGSETVINENIKKYYDIDKVLKFSQLNLNDDKSVDFLLPKNVSYIVGFSYMKLMKRPRKTFLIC